MFLRDLEYLFLKLLDSADGTKKMPSKSARMSLVQPEHMVPNMKIALMKHIRGRLVVVGRLRIVRFNRRTGEAVVAELKTGEELVFNVLAILNQGGFFWRVSDADAFLEKGRAVLATQLFKGR